MAVNILYIMAEALGTVASAIQLASNVKDIWKFFHAIKAAPKEIVELRRGLRELECLLASVESTVQFASSLSTNNELDQTLNIIRSEIQGFAANTPMNDKTKSLKERIKWVLLNKAIAKEMAGRIENSKLSLAIVLQNMTR